MGIFSGILSCQKDPAPPPPLDPEQYILTLPRGFSAPAIPADNQLTVSRVALGRRLFYDPILSRDSTRSCASCHAPHKAFSDSTAISLGIEQRPGIRNTIALSNVAYQKRLLREGGIPSLEGQILVPIQEHNEFDFNIVQVAERLQRIPAYVELAQKAYQRIPDAFVITRAIAAFERTMISGESPFDQWYFQEINLALTPAAKRGWELFQNERLNCSKCHSGFLFTNQEYASNGLYEVYPDSGKIRLTGLETDRAVFKIPSLRNIAVTQPYMHDGSLATLEAVLDHYQSGGKNHPNKSPLLKPFTLSPTERTDLLAFLNSLTDRAFLENKDLKSPF